VKKNYTRVPLDQPNPAFKNETATWLPLLNVRVSWNHKQTPRIPAVVDSGSQCCLFRADIGEYLGIDVKNGIEDVIGGLSQGMREPVFYHKVKLYIESDWIIDVTAGFVKKLSVAGILGRNGFFDNFRARFDHSGVPPIVEIERIEKIQ
jgi:hypothetical protein